MEQEAFPPKQALRKARNPHMGSHAVLPALTFMLSATKNLFPAHAVTPEPDASRPAQHDNSRTACVITKDLFSEI